MKIIHAIATLSGTIIGVGIFALPYITLKVGFWVMFGYFLILGSLVILVHTFFGELSLKTPDSKRLPGFAKIYLGRTGEMFSYFVMILGIFGALLAYLIVGGEFLESLLGPFLGGNNLLYTFLYFIFGSLIIFLGIKAVSKVEFWGLVIFLLILLIVFFKLKFFINIDNLFLSPDLSFLFLPYGAVLFSLWGASLVPEIEEMLGEKKKFLKYVILSSIFIAAVVYLFFIYLILGVAGSGVTESALTGIKEFLGDGAVSLLVFFGLLTTFTSFIALGLTLKKVFWYDLKLNKNLAWLITSFVPFILFLIGMKKYVLVISFVGGIMLGLEGILILLMYKKIQPKNILIYPLILIFLVGIIYGIIYIT